MNVMRTRAVHLPVGFKTDLRPSICQDGAFCLRSDARLPGISPGTCPGPRWLPRQLWANRPPGGGFIIDRLQSRGRSASQDPRPEMIPFSFGCTF